MSSPKGSNGIIDGQQNAEEFLNLMQSSISRVDCCMGDFMTGPDDISDEKFWVDSDMPYDDDKSQEIILVEWRVFEVQTKDLLTEWHLVGYNGVTGEEHISGALKRLDATAGTGVSISGEEYYLAGMPGDRYRINGDENWQAWAKVDLYASKKDVTFEIWKRGDDWDDEELIVLNPLLIPDS